MHATTKQYKQVRRVGIAVVLAGLLAFPFSGVAQWRLKGPFNKWSVEVQSGIDWPVWEGIQEADKRHETRVRVPGVKLGVRCMFSDWFGLRPFYAQHRFDAVPQEGSSEPSTQLKLYRYGIDGVLNLADVLPPGDFRRPRKLNFLLHIGGSYAYSNYQERSVTPRVDRKIAIGSIGITPQWRLSRDLVLVADWTAQGTVGQNFGFTGAPIGTRAQRWHPTGIYFSGSLGIHYYLGRYIQHMDWK